MNLLGVVVTGFTLCAASACVKVPPFEHRDAGNSSSDGGADAPADANEGKAAVEIVQSGGDVIVHGPGYDMVFGTGGSRFPYQLIVGGEHFMGGSQGCGDEQAMGIALWPVQRIGSTDTSNMGATTVTIPLEGPSVGQVRVAWNTGYQCSPTTGALDGHTTFSFFPDGRLTRFDVITNATEQMAASCTACFGGMASQFVLTSFTTLTVDSGAFLSDGTEATFDTHGEEVNPGLTACVRQRGQSVAFSWVEAPTRLRVVNESPRSIAFVKDIRRVSTLAAETVVAITQMGISAADNCGTVEDRIRPFSDSDHSVRINGTPVGAALTDGIFGGDPRPNGYPVDFPVTIQPGETILPRMPAGFAVWLYSNPIPANLTLTHSGGHTGNWYRLQRVGQDQLVIWFDVSLEQGELITISGS